jgi:glutaredoxin 3
MAPPHSTHYLYRSLTGIEELMAKVEIYTTMFCPYCARARGLLGAKKVAFEEVDLLEQPARRAEMLERSGGSRTVPQIFIDGEHIGGCDELLALERAGKLDPKLGTGA